MNENIISKKTIGEILYPPIVCSVRNIVLTQTAS